jgi:PLP dependent protein
MTTIAKNLHAINLAIAQGMRLANRHKDAIQLLAVSKGVSAASVREAHQAGQRAFGENYTQEALNKIELLRDLSLQWHFIGPIQGNKTQAIAAHFAWAHGVDRSKIAERLSAQRPTDLPPLNVCIQVNVDEEASKSGIMSDNLLDLARTVANLPRLKLRGLMCIPAPTEGLENQRIPFAKLRELLQEINTHGLAMDTLSMGMSHDFNAAILEGATIMRIGTAIFGRRSYEGAQ